MGLTTILMWLLLLIMIVPQGFNYDLTVTPSSSDLLSKIVWMVLLGGGFVVIFQNIPRLLGLVKWINPFLLAYLALALTSVLWSIEPSFTLRRVLRAGSALLVCIAFCVAGWDPSRPQKILRSILDFVMLASIIFVIVDPIDATHQSLQPELLNAWHGITIGKNILGPLATISILLWLQAWMTREVLALRATIGIAMAGLCLVMCRSATSLLAAAFSIIFFLILVRSPTTLKRSMPYLVGLFAAAVLIYALAVLGLIDGLDIVLRPISMLTGKDMTFTGRTAIWDVLKENIAHHPWLGNGYGAYWIGPVATSPSYEMLTRLYFYPTEGHNGYLDVINDLGWVGALCLLGFFIAYLRQALALMRTDRSKGALYLALIFRGFLADMSESHWMLSTSVDYVIMTFMTVNLGRHSLQVYLDRRQAKQAPAPLPDEPTLQRRLNPGGGMRTWRYRSR